jgi:hypothetical protein
MPLLVWADNLVFFIICNNTVPSIPPQPFVLGVINEIIDIVFLVVFSRSRNPTPGHDRTRGSQASATLRFSVLLSYRIASVNPIGIYVDGGREIFASARISRCSGPHYIVTKEGWLTIDGALELLVANLAWELAHARPLVELDGNRFLVVTEEARERRRQRLVLQRTWLELQAREAEGRILVRTLFLPWGLAAFFRFPYSNEG